jgi:hypothetical protein
LKPLAFRGSHQRCPEYHYVFQERASETPDVNRVFTSDAPMGYIGLGGNPDVLYDSAERVGQLQKAAE